MKLWQYYRQIRRTQRIYRSAARQMLRGCPKGDRMKTAVLIVAAGKGERTGRSQPKKYEPVAGKPMLRWTAEAFGNLPVTVVIGPGQNSLYRAALPAGAAPIT